MKIITVLTLIMLIGPPNVLAEQISYEIVDFAQDSNGILVAKGSKDYTADDIRVRKRGKPGDVFWSKRLPLEKGYCVGASIYREPKITGSNPTQI